MSRRFPLQTVERLRAAELDRAGRQLAAARAQVAEAQSRLAGLQAQLRSCMTPGSTSPAEVGVASARRDLLRDSVEQAKSELVGRSTTATAAVATWSAARAGLRAVESLHDRHRIAQAEAELRREQLLSDELAAVLSAFPDPFFDPGRVTADVGPRPGGDAA